MSCHDFCNSRRYDEELSEPAVPVGRRLKSTPPSMFPDNPLGMDSDAEWVRHSQNNSSSAKCRILGARILSCKTQPRSCKGASVVFLNQWQMSLHEYRCFPSLSPIHEGVTRHNPRPREVLWRHKPPWLFDDAVAAIFRREFI
jgi:hypothetical protein